MPQFMDIEVFDGHQHLTKPSKAARLMEKADQFHYRRINAASLACCAGVSPGSLLANVAGMVLKAMYPGRAYFFGGFVYHVPGKRVDEADVLAQARRLFEIGVDGIKLIESKPNIRKDLKLSLDAPMYEGFYSFMEENRFPVLSHVADMWDFWMWDFCPEWAKKLNWFYGDGTYESQKTLMDEFERVLARHPKMRTMLAHMYFKSQELPGAYRVMEQFPNAIMDMTPGSQMYWHFRPIADQWREFFIRYQDRIIFGTDLFDRDNEEDVPRMELVRGFLERSDEFDFFSNKVQGIALEQPVLEKIYRANFDRLTGGNGPRPLNIEAALEYCLEMKSTYAGSSFETAIKVELDWSIEKLRSLAG